MGETVIDPNKSVPKKGVIQRVAEGAQIASFQDMLKAIEKYGSLDRAKAAEPHLFTAAGILSILAGHPGKGPTK